MQYKVNLPYPKIKVEKKDKNIALMLLNSYAGKISEDTAIHDYIFQMMMLNHPEYKSILKGIAIVEMHHLEILGNLIYALGITPIFGKIKDDALQWFNGSFVNYSDNFTYVLQHNIYEEQMTINQYQKIIKTTTDANIKEILNRIILDEELHIEIFSKMLALTEKK